MPNYDDGKIYKLISPSGLTYIGSTCSTLPQRMSKHKYGYKKWKEIGTEKINSTAYQLFDEDINNVKITLVQLYPCENRSELENRERYLIEKLKCVNKHVPTRTGQEWRQQNYKKNKDKIVKANSQYYAKNRQKIIARHKMTNKALYEKKKEQFCEKHDCGCGGKYTITNKRKHCKTMKHQLHEMTKIRNIISERMQTHYDFILSMEGIKGEFKTA